MVEKFVAGLNAGDSMMPLLVNPHECGKHDLVEA
jgi:hypothetical protein